MKFFDWNSNVEKDMNIVYSSIEELNKKMEGLYRLDHHSFNRPKVDILEDNTDSTEQSIWTHMSTLQDRIEKLERNKK